LPRKWVLQCLGYVRRQLKNAGKCKLKKKMKGSGKRKEKRPGAHTAVHSTRRSREESGSKPKKRNIKRGGQKPKLEVKNRKEKVSENGMMQHSRRVKGERSS